VALMRVCKYLPSRLYGFVVDDAGTEVFFHLGVFQPGDNAQVAPAPPILGERVEVEIDEESRSEKKAPRAKRVTRTTPPQELNGKVESFDPSRGFGFIVGDDGETYHLHMSEVLGGKIPLNQKKVSFYKGLRIGKLRACHVKIH